MEQITVKIDGMMCGHCEAHVSDAFRAQYKTKSVSSSHTKGETVIVTDETITDEQIKNTVDGTGYTFIEVAERKPYEKKSLFGGAFAKKN